MRPDKLNCDNMSAPMGLRTIPLKTHTHTHRASECTLTHVNTHFCAPFHHKLLKGSHHKFHLPLLAGGCHFRGKPGQPSAGGLRSFQSAVSLGEKLRFTPVSQTKPGRGSGHERGKGGHMPEHRCPSLRKPRRQGPSLADCSPQ